jgi:hypothetical protein
MKEPSVCSSEHLWIGTSSSEYMSRDTLRHESNLIVKANISFFTRTRSDQDASGG